MGSPVDWAAVAASISTGVAAVAGIGATVWQASRTWSYQDKREKTVERRRIYASLITKLTTVLDKSSAKSQTEVTPEVIKRIHEYGDALRDALDAISELTLIAPSNVASHAHATLGHIINRSPGKETNHSMIEMLRAMRSDLGEPELFDASFVVPQFSATETAPNSEQ